MVDSYRPTDEPLLIGDVSLRSRLLVGTGKYASFEETARALEISGTDCVTVAVRRVNLDASKGPSLLDHIDRERYRILPNTAGCYDVKSAVRTAELARELLGTELVKLEVLGDEKTLLPDPIGTLEATRELVRQGFTVMVYCSDDPRMAVHLAQAGAASVMPAGSPIGSGQGVLNPNAIRITLELVDVPVIVDAGVGTASDVAFAMELGAAGVLLNTGIAGAREPLRMAAAMRDACHAGRNAFLAGRIPRKLYANASSPTEGLIGGVIGSPAPRQLTSVAPWQDPEPVAEAAATDAVPTDAILGAPLAGVLLVIFGLLLLPLARGLTRSVFPRPGEFAPRWQFVHVALVALAGLSLVVLLGAASSVLGLESSSALLGLSVSALILGGACLLVFLLAERLDPAGWRCLGLGPGANGRAVLVGLASYLLAVPGLFGLMLLWPWMMQVAGLEHTPQEIAQQLLALSGPELWGAAALAVLVMPLLEEILFRAFLQPLLVQSLGAAGGIAATSGLFALLHGASAFLPIFGLSLVLGAVMLRTRRLSSAFCVHALHNGVTLLFLFLLPASRDLMGGEATLPDLFLP